MRREGAPDIGLPYGANWHNTRHRQSSEVDSCLFQQRDRVHCTYYHLRQCATLTKLLALIGTSRDSTPSIFASSSTRRRVGLGRLFERCGNANSCTTSWGLAGSSQEGSFICH